MLYIPRVDGDSEEGITTARINLRVALEQTHFFLYVDILGRNASGPTRLKSNGNKGMTTYSPEVLNRGLNAG